MFQMHVCMKIILQKNKFIVTLTLKSVVYNESVFTESYVLTLAKVPNKTYFLKIKFSNVDFLLDLF